MATRNFYVRADIDGRRTQLSGGPASKEGGMTIELTQRCEGGIIPCLKIVCHASEDGILYTEVFDGKRRVYRMITNR